MSEKKTVLVTGSDGLIGRESLALLSKQYNVIGLCRKFPVEPVDDVKYVIADLSETLISQVLPNNITHILHLAQSSQFRHFPEKALDIVGVNITSTANLLDFAVKHGVKSFTYASSGGVYGTGRAAFDENSPITVNSELGFYLGSKCCAEILVANYSKLLDVKIIRPFFVYGERQNKDMLIPRLVERVLNNQPVTLQGNEGIKINPIYVGDAARAIVKLLEMPNSLTINIAGDEVLSIKQIADQIGKLANVSPIFETNDAPANDLVADISLLNELKLSLHVSFEQGIAKLLSVNYGL